MTDRQRAVIFDVDGTLCDVSSIRYLLDGKDRNFHRFHVESTGCPTNPHVAALTHALKPDVARVVVTARSTRYYQHTIWWMMLNNVRFDTIYMRQDGDFRKDAIVKQEILNQINEHYDVKFAIDDNPNVIEVWKRNGIPTAVIPGWTP